MDHKRDFRKKQKEYSEVLKMQAVRDWGWDFSCLAERKMRKGIIVVFRYVKAAEEKGGVFFPYLLWKEPEKTGLRLNKED